MALDIETRKEIHICFTLLPVGPFYVHLYTKVIINTMSNMYVQHNQKLKLGLHKIAGVCGQSTG